MNCYDNSTLRAWLDEQPSLHAGTSLDDISEHVRNCEHCQRVSADLVSRSSVAASAIGLLTAPPLTTAAISAAFNRVRAVPSAEIVEVAPRRRRSFTRPASAVAAAAVVFAIAGTPAGRSSAASFLEQFRSTKIAIVEISENDEAALSELAQLGAVSGEQGLNAERVESVTAAAAAVGFPVSVVDTATLPGGVSSQGEVRVSSRQQLRFTLDRSRTQAWLADKKSSVVVPERFNGASIVVEIPAVVVQHYPASDGSPGVIVGQARQVTATTEGGVTLEEFRSLLLSLPGLSDGTRRQLERIGDWRETLPLPIPAGAVGWKETTLAGSEALMLADNTGLLSAGIWQRDGFIYGVAVRGKAEQVRAVAAGLR